MHTCPQCKQLCDCEDSWDCLHMCNDADAIADFDLDYCVDCGDPAISTMCECCGGWLCHRHAETGAGFCKACPTQEWIDEQTRAL